MLMELKKVVDTSLGTKLHAEMGEFLALKFMKRAANLMVVAATEIPASRWLHYRNKTSVSGNISASSK